MLTAMFSDIFNVALLISVNVNKGCVNFYAVSLIVVKSATYHQKLISILSNYLLVFE